MTTLAPRHFVVPLIVFAVIASLPAPAGEARTGCGAALARIADPGVRASFDRQQRSQSAAAAKACVLYEDMELVALAETR